MVRLSLLTERRELRGLYVPSSTWDESEENLISVAPLAVQLTGSWEASEVRFRRSSVFIPSLHCHTEYVPHRPPRAVPSSPAAL